MRHRHYRDGQEPLGLPSSAQLPRRHRGGDLLLQARVRRRPLHLARTGPLQGLHLVRRGGAQPGAVRPAQTGLAASDCKVIKNRQIRPSSTARLPIPVQVVATNARNAPVAHHAHVVLPLATPLKNTPLWTRTSLARTGGRTCRRNTVSRRFPRNSSAKATISSNF